MVELGDDGKKIDRAADMNNTVHDVAYEEISCPSVKAPRGEGEKDEKQIPRRNNIKRIILYLHC